MSEITTHVLDTSRGRPAGGVPVTLELENAGGSWEQIGKGSTDADGRAKDLLTSGFALRSGVYRLVFHPDSPFFARVELEISLEAGHYHVPLIVSPYSCTIYRGS